MQISSPMSERGKRGESRVDAACYQAIKPARLAARRSGGLHATAGTFARPHLPSNTSFAQLYLSAEMPGPSAGSA
jgi:hypothetical protein